MNPIAFAILIIIVVFLPLFSLTGLEGKLFKPMAYTITFRNGRLPVAFSDLGTGAGRPDPQAEGGARHFSGAKSQEDLSSAAGLGT
ncbi:hypothetical protein [Variovorax sp. WDL1]|uniref:hypothetical protein n=1 Tax=Variovorax sp. WDL1 TaxID=207745 RepID=UPI003FCD64AB